MLLFSDGFDSWNVDAVGYKWGLCLNNNNNPAMVGVTLVSGIDPVVNKPYATKDGRAIHVVGTGNGLCLGTAFRPSRTVFLGFAFRATASTGSVTTIVITFRNRVDIERGDHLQQGGGKSALLSTLTLTVSQFQVGISWTFTGEPTQVGTINTNADMRNGDYHYIQVGWTLNGSLSAQPQGWAEVRIGNRGTHNCRFDNILTTLPDGAGEMFTSFVSLVSTLPWETAPACTIDDFYLCNDEGNVNNTFLGNVKVRRALPVAEGTENDSTPLGFVYRHSCVNEDFLGFRPLPAPPPTYEQDPLYIPWENPFASYLSLTNAGDRQLFRFTNVGFFGSQPQIHGAILHALARAKYRNVPGSTTLKGIKITGLLPPIEANPADVPLSFTREYTDLVAPANYCWQTHPLVFENDEIVSPGQPYQIWNTVVVNDSQYGFDLAACTLDPILYGQNLTRFNLTSYEVVAENLRIVDFTHRFFDESAADAISIVDSAPLYERTFKVVDSLYWDVETAVYRMFYKSVNDTITFDEVIPWIYLFGQSQMGISDEIFLEWQDLVAEDLAIDDWGTGFWEEWFDDAIEVADSVVASFIERLEEMFGLEEPYLWDGHEDVEETLEINVSYVWDNHELMEEYIYPDDSLTQGVGLFAADTFGLEEDHFDGWLVELMEENLALADSVLTQQWRYERFFGIVLNSWQVSPVEQEGSDGNHNGDNPWGW